MEKYSIEGTPKTPSINFDLGTGVLEVKGNSTPENAIAFYKPLMDALERYAGSPKSVTRVEVKFNFLNTASSKCILDIFEKLESVFKRGNSVTISWYYKDDDEDMKEAGEDYQSIVDLPFNIIKVPA